MHFPVVFTLFGRPWPSHEVMDLAAYFCAGQLFWLLRRRRVFPRATLGFEPTIWMLVGCVTGAAIGAKSLAWIESWPYYSGHLLDPGAWRGGMTIVGGLLGGWGGVEVAKRVLGIRQSTGDVYVFPAILGMAIGRIGCFLTGLPDHTCGLPTNLPWGVDFGDGIPRHPTQLYDIAFLAVLAALLVARMRWPRRDGTLFHLFLFGYLSWRLMVEFIKPRYHFVFGLSAIQTACVIGLLILTPLLARPRRRVAAAMM